VTRHPRLTDELAHLLAQDGPRSGTHLARRLRARKADALCELRANPAFERVGRGSSSVWRLAGSEQPGNRLGTGQEPPEGGGDAGARQNLLNQLAGIEQRLDALERLVEGP
jgi:hypothetical protein